MAGSVTFMLGKLGAVAAARFAEKLAAQTPGLKPRHCAVLELASRNALSQLELAQRIGVTPSVVVDMLDELQALGAVRRVSQAADRRRRVVELTPVGQRMRAQAAAAAHEVDAELLGGLPPAERRSLQQALTSVSAAHGLSYS